MPQVQIRYADVVAADGLVHLLDEVELTRLGRLRDAAARDAFASGRALARRALAELTRAAPESVGLDSICPRCGRPHGKARYADRAAPGLSVTRGGGVVAVALAEGPVGLDLEPLLGATDLMTSAETFLSPVELDAHRLRPAAERPLALLRTWVRKEAALKATGDGLLVDPAHLTLGDPDAAPILMAWEGVDDEPVLRMADVDLGEGLVACVAVLSDQPPTVTVAPLELA